MRVFLHGLLLTVGLLTATPALSVFPVLLPEPEGPSVSLGNRPATGQDAFQGIPDRAYLVRQALACGNELSFLWEFNNALEVERTLGAQGDVAHADWPVGYLVAKAAALAFRDLDTHDSSCKTRLDLTTTRLAWRALVRPGTSTPDSADVFINLVYKQFFGEDCANAVSRVDPANDKSLNLTVSERCMMAQIRIVMLEDLHGPWSIDVDSRRRLPRYPGTDPTTLPCVTMGQKNIKNALGDWDMSVVQYTRLAQLMDIARGRKAWPELATDAQAVLDRLDSRFLSIRGPPAREYFNILYSCGNTDRNYFGSADDTLANSSPRVDTGKYDNDAEDAVAHRTNGRSAARKILDDLWRLFKALAALAVVLAAGALLGAAAAAIAGALPAGVAAAAAAGLLAVAGSAVLILGSLGLFSGIPESENHLLMENSSTYLKNKRMLRELRLEGNEEGFQYIADYNEDVRTWLLSRLQEIVEKDFREYNAKPYARLSHEALINLIDYSCAIGWNYQPILLRGDDCDAKDQPLARAAAAVFDLSAAKVAVGSSQGRRSVPYRRLVGENYEFASGNRSLLELFAGADHLLAAQQFWTGETRHGPDSQASFRSLGHMIWYATSRYRPHATILSVAIDKTTPIEQQYAHHSHERYSSGRRWLISAGGDDESPPEGLHTPFGVDLNLTFLGFATNDRGVGVPTMLMVTGGTDHTRSRVTDFIRFEGNVIKWSDTAKDKQYSYSDNRCVSKGFACGLHLIVPDDIKNSCKLHADTHRNIYFIDSEHCAAFDDGDPNDRAGEFFLLVYENPRGDGRHWGFIEVAEKSSVGDSLDDYAARLIRANLANFARWDASDGSDPLKFSSVVRGQDIEFEPEDEDFGADERACGDVVNHQGGARFTISLPGERRPSTCAAPEKAIVIDLDDEEAPRRYGRGVELEPLFRGDHP